MSEVKITPLARRLAEENGIDWQTLRGTGPEGTVLERDILAFLARVMAGEIDLPPSEAAPADKGFIPNVSQVQAALQREGLRLDDLVPEASLAQASTAPGPQTTDYIDFDLDLSIDEPEPAAPEPVNATWPEPPAAPQLNLDAWETEVPAVPLEAAASALDSWDQIEFAKSEPELPSFAEAMAPQEPAFASAPSALGESLPQETLPEFEVPEPSPEAGPAQVTPPAATVSSMESAAAVTRVAAPAQEMAPSRVGGGLRIQAWQRLVDTAPAQEAAATLSEVWGYQVSLLPLLYRAAEKSLSDLNIARAVCKGVLEGDYLASHVVAPAASLKEAVDALEAARAQGQGLAVLTLPESFDQLLFPGAELLSLGRALGDKALLSYSGSLDSKDAAALLERVAFYLERPILLA